MNDIKDILEKVERYGEQNQSTFPLCGEMMNVKDALSEIKKKIEDRLTCKGCNCSVCISIERHLLDLFGDKV